MQCPKCHQQLPEHAAFCSRCGANMKVAVPSGKNTRMPLFAIAFAIGVLGFFMFIVSARTSSKVRSIQGTPQVNTPDSHDLDWHVETARDSTPGPTPLGPWKPRSNTHITIQNADGTSREATDAERQMIERSIRGSGH